MPLTNRSRLVVDGLAGARLSTRRSNNGTAILLVYSDTQSEQACNHEYHDYDADDVEDAGHALSPFLLASTVGVTDALAYWT